MRKWGHKVSDTNDMSDTIDILEQRYSQASHRHRFKLLLGYAADRCCARTLRTEPPSYVKDIEAAIVHVAAKLMLLKRQLICICLRSSFDLNVAE